MKLFTATFASIVLTSTAALAGGAVVVPEIGAVGGIGAALAVGAAVAFIWERRRKR